MIRQANKQDISRIAEIIVFGKRVAYRPIFETFFDRKIFIDRLPSWDIILPRNTGVKV